MARKILVATAGVAPAKQMADYVVDIAESLKVSLVVLHILHEGETDADGAAALDVFVRSAKARGIPIEREVRQGNIAANIIKCGEDVDAAMIVMGASQGNVVSRWMSAEVRHQTSIPVVVIPHYLES